MKPLTRKNCAVIALVLAAVCPRSSIASDATRPNVIVILTEDQGAHLGFLGTPGLQTPPMDSLARTGVYFDQAFVVYPVCSA